MLDFLFPPRCPECHRYVGDNGIWCDGCKKKYIEARRYVYPLASPIMAAYVFTVYNGTVKYLLHRLKFQRDESVLAFLRHIRDEAWKSADDDFRQTIGDRREKFSPSKPKDISFFARDEKKFDFVIPIPLHPKREKERGFNQTALLWKDFFDNQMIPWVDILIRTRETAPQYGLNRTARFENVKNAFAIKEDWQKSLAGKNVLIVDDILTTGATLTEAAKIIKKAGANNVIVFALASGRDMDDGEDF